MTENEARQIIADEMMEVYKDEVLPQSLKDLYLPMSRKVLNGSDRSFACLQRIEYLMTGVYRPLLPS